MPKIGSYPVRGGLLLFTLLAGVALVGRLARISPSTAGAPVVINETAVPPIPTLNPEWVTRGMVIYARECATCHGANLEGLPDWKQSLPDGSLPPPPHDSSGHTWHHPDSLLLAIIAEGGDPAYNSKMPAFRDKLTEEERRAVLEFIKSTWGENEREFQWWMTATESGS
ncbi:MAG TPA: cytochrome c [Anaerolineales bacterium]